MVGRLGFEPRTYWLKAKCSTIELTTRNNKMVADAGLEPASPNGREILSLVCIPIPPISHVYNVSPSTSYVNVFLLCIL